MHQVMVDIILDALVEQYATETIFCEDYLKIDLEKWQAWKQGKNVLTNEEMQKIKTLFTDYEWMIIQKILQQSSLFPEKRNYAVAEYKRIKTVIAKHWLKSGLGVAELVSDTTASNVGTTAISKSFINLRVVNKYGEWGYDDILEFRLPAMIQRQIERARVDLLEWVNENLTDTYVKDQNSFE